MNASDSPRRNKGDGISVVCDDGRAGWLGIVGDALALDVTGKDGRTSSEPLFWCRLTHLLSLTLDEASCNTHTPESNHDSSTHLTRATLSTPTLTLSALTSKGSHLKLTTKTLSIPSEQHAEAQSWISRTLRAAYGDQIPGRRVLLVVNPVGGKGKGKAVVEDVVLPILRAAGCRVTVQETKYSKHAEELAQTMSLEFDVIATASGDGLIHELINGFATRSNGSEARRGLRIPIVPIPTGSANGLCINLQGVEETFNIPLACLNVIKGRPMPLDICSVKIGQKRRWSFMTIAAGLMCDVDLGTEHLRWMGDARFVYGFIRGLVANRPMKCRVHIKVVTADKALMIQRLNASRQKLSEAQKETEIPRSATTTEPESDAVSPSIRDTNAVNKDGNESEVNAMPPFQELRPSTEEGWITLESGTAYGTGKKTVLGDGNDGSMQDLRGTWRDGEGILYIYTGLVPYVARDLMQFPVVVPGDGLVDVCVQTLVPRSVLAGSIAGAEKGEPFWLDCQHYHKASAFIIEPLEEGKLVSIDGEAAAFEKMSVQVHRGLARTCSLNGGWAMNPFGMGGK